MKRQGPLPLLLLLLIATLFSAVVRGESVGSRACDGSGLAFCPQYLLNVAGIDPSTWNASTAVSPAVRGNGDVLLLTTWFGAYPCIGFGCNNNLSYFCNGGLPQMANLTLHVLEMERDLAYMKVPLNFSGYVVHDYEAWLPSWNMTGEVYRNASLTLAASQLLNATPAEVYRKAKEDYQNASIAFLVTTITTIRRLLPLAAGYGFYGYPATYGYWVDNLTRSAELNDELDTLWQHIPTFYPSLYLPYESNVDVPLSRNEQWIAQQVNESMRLSQRVAAVFHQAMPAVLPYTWYRYHPGEPHALELLTTMDAALEFQFPSTVAAAWPNALQLTNLIVWGDEVPSGSGSSSTANATDAEAWFVQHRDVFTCNKMTAVHREAAVESEGKMTQAPHFGGFPTLSHLVENLPQWKWCSL